MKILRGNVYVVDFHPRVHTKPGKSRPAVVIQSNLVNEAGYPSTIVVPTTSKTVDDAGFMRLKLPKGICGLEKSSDVLLGQVIAVANLSFKKDLGPLPPEWFTEIESRLKVIMGLA
jgi:mRNA interferase MazF